MQYLVTEYYTILFVFPLGKKNEGGIAFDDEDEKEQWEEDQKVRLIPLFLVILVTLQNIFLVCQ